MARDPLPQAIPSSSHAGPEDPWRENCGGRLVPGNPIDCCGPTRRLREIVPLGDSGSSPGASKLSNIRPAYMVWPCEPHRACPEPDALLHSVRIQFSGVGARKLAHCHGPSARQPFDVIVGSGHHAVLIVLHRATKMLNDIRRHTHGLDRLAI